MASKHSHSSHDICLNILFLVCTSVSHVYSGREQSQGVTEGYLIPSLGCYFLIVFIFLSQDFMQPKLALSSWSLCPLFSRASITVLHHHFQIVNYFIIIFICLYIYIHTYMCIYMHMSRVHPCTWHVCQVVRRQIAGAVFLLSSCTSQ